MCKALRHDKFLRVNAAGYAVIEDIITRFNSHGDYFMKPLQLPTVADLVYVANHVTHTRFEASAIADAYAPGPLVQRVLPRTLLLRCVQGHSGPIGSQLDDERAFTPILRAELLPRLVHFTLAANITGIVGSPTSPGLYPGGFAKRANGLYDRRHVHCSTCFKSAMGIVPDSFQKPGIDTAIHLDTNSILNAGLKIFLTNTGTALIPTQVGSEHILRVCLADIPRLTIYSRPTEEQRRLAPSSPPRCPFCRRTWNFGTWWCTTCWEPLTVQGIQDRVTHMNSKADRIRELDERYGLTHATLQELLVQDKLVCVPISIRTRSRRSAAGAYRADDPQVTDHGIPVALAALAAPPAKAFPGKVPPPPNQAFTTPTQVGSRAEPTQVGQLPRRADCQPQV